MTDPADSEAEDLAARVVLALRNRVQTVATAESLTGGLVGATITTVPGASAVYRGGLITYATELKAELAGVSPAVLAADGPVAPTTAAQLAQGAARTCGADWGLATTGVAGPDPQDGHPVGQVFVAVAGPASVDFFGSSAGERGVQVRELSLTGDRAAIRARAVAAVLRLLVEQLEAPAAPTSS
jgi:nicotinamide-nucleotide amidase